MSYCKQNSLQVIKIIKWPIKMLVIINVEYKEEKVT